MGLRWFSVQWDCILQTDWCQFIRAPKIGCSLKWLTCRNKWFEMNIMAWILEIIVQPNILGMNRAETSTCHTKCQHYHEIQYLTEEEYYIILYYIGKLLFYYTWTTILPSATTSVVSALRIATSGLIGYTLQPVRDFLWRLW